MPEAIPMDGIDIPDTLMDQHFTFDAADLGGDTDTDDAGGTDSDDDSAPDSDDEDTRAGQPGSDDDGEADTDEDDDAEDGEGGEDGDAKPDAKDTGAAGKKSKGSPGAEGEDGFGFDRKKLDQIKDPEARAEVQKAYREMQGDYTRAKMALAEVRREAERFSDDYEDFVSDLATPEGATSFLHTVAESRPQVFTEAVLVDLALRIPEVFEAAVERVAKIQEDPRERKEFERDLKDDARERDDKAASTQEVRSRQREMRRQLDQVVGARAAHHGFRSNEAVEMINTRVHALLAKNAKAQKRTTKADVEAEVDRAAGLLRSERAEGRKEAGAARDKQAREAAVAAAAKAKRKPAPDPRSGDALAERGKRLDPSKLPKRDEDRIKGLVDQYF